MSEKLLPCPFCKQTPQPQGLRDFWFLSCLTCQIEQSEHFVTKDAAIKAWNKLAKQVPQDE